MTQRIDGLLGASVVLLATHSVASALYSGHWLIDLTTHFRPFEIVVLTVLAAIMAWRRASRAGYAALGALVAATAFFSLPGSGRADEAAAGAAINVVSLNVWTPNRRKAEVAAWIESALVPGETNVVFLMETNAAWVEGLSVLSARLPHRIALARSDNFGLVLLSDAPLSEVGIVEFDSLHLPAVAGTISAGGKRVRIVGVHTLPPVGKRGFSMRNEYFSNLRSYLDSEDVPTIVFGDLNCSPWSGYIRMVTGRDLADSFRGLFRPHTWRAFGGLLSVPIDYVLYTAHFKRRSASIGPELGSDHRAVIARLQVRGDSAH